jgi:DNA topoisomerase-1
MPSRSAARKPRDLLHDARAAARAAKLHYVTSNEPGIERRGSKGRFRYFDANGRRVRNAATLRRVESLVIPPAWQNVWIARSANAHLQATGFDARGRKQYRYHPDFRRIRDREKYRDILPFVHALPRLRRAVQRDLRGRELSKEYVLAAVVSLLERTQIRVGNEKYAQDNASYGLTTLRSQHARVAGDALELRFRGKSGKLWSTSVRDRRLAAAVKRCRELPGQLLFQYLDARGRSHRVTSSHVNAYLHERMGEKFSAKEFRTWAGTLSACTNLFGCEPCTSQRRAKQNVRRALERVADELGNTVAVCRKSYVDPRLFDCYVQGELHRRFERCLSEARRHPVHGLSREELAVSRLLEGLRGKEAAVARAVSALGTAASRTLTRAVAA